MADSQTTVNALSTPLTILAKPYGKRLVWSLSLAKHPKNILTKKGYAMNNLFSIGQPVWRAKGPGWNGRIIAVYEGITGLRYAVLRAFGKIHHYNEKDLMPFKHTPTLVMVKGGKYDLPEIPKRRLDA